MIEKCLNLPSKSKLEFYLSKDFIAWLFDKFFSELVVFVPQVLLYLFKIEDYFPIKCSQH